MNIYLVSTDLELKKAIDNTGLFEKSHMVEGFNGIEELTGIEEYDIIVISDKLINSNDIVINDYSEFRGRKVYYMLSNYKNRRAMENITSICKSKKINVIPPKLSINQVLERITLDLFPNTRQNSNAIAIFGADAKVGTTMVSTAISEMLAANTNTKVLLLSLNGQRGTSFIKDATTESGMDSIRVKLANQILSKEELLDCCIQKGNFYMLPGIDSILDIRHYQAEHIEYLINIASQIANIVIIDCGNAANIDFAGSLSITGLNAGRYKYLITTQQKIAFDVFKRTNEQVLNLLDINPEDFLLIVNNYYNSNGLPTPEELCKKYEINLAGKLPYLDFKGWEAEFERNTLLNNTEFNNEIEDIAKLIATQLDIRYIEKQTKKSFLNGVLKKFK